MNKVCTTKDLVVCMAVMPNDRSLQEVHVFFVASIQRGGLHFVCCRVTR